MKKNTLCFGLTALLFVSCATVGDIMVHAQRENMEEDLAAVETLIVPLEAAGGIQARQMASEMIEARRAISRLEGDFVADSYFFAKLTAWSGRLAILEGRFSEAQRLHRQSSALSAGNVPSIILGIRLEGDPARRLELIETELAIIGNQPSALGFGELQIERGRSLFEINRFSEAAGAFDSAFASVLNEVYNISYAPVRNQAWELRHASGVRAATVAMLAQDTITWRDFISITSAETGLLRFLSAGRTMSETEYFNRLIDRGMLPFIQDINQNEWPLARPSINETVTRAGAAFLIWHLYAQARADRRLLSLYSARFARGPNPRSPIADVPVLTPFFDAIVGSVESEFLNLPDGRHFRPAEPVRGADVLRILQRIDS